MQAQALIHPIAWKGNSQKFGCRILHKRPAQGCEDAV
jgi:hypothetical protein